MIILLGPASTPVTPQSSRLRPISLLRSSLLRLLDSNFPGNFLWTWEFQPLEFRLCLSHALRNPESIERRLAVRPPGAPQRPAPRQPRRPRLNGYVVQRVPSLFLAGSFRMCLDCEVLKGMFPGGLIIVYYVTVSYVMLYNCIRAFCIMLNYMLHYVYRSSFNVPSKLSRCRPS